MREIIDKYFLFLLFLISKVSFKTAKWIGCKTRIGIFKYRNPDSNCTYPFEPCAVGYCWGYARAVDDNKTSNEIKEMCISCDLYKLYRGKNNEQPKKTRINTTNNKVGKNTKCRRY